VTNKHCHTSTNTLTNTHARLQGHASATESVFAKFLGVFALKLGLNGLSLGFLTTFFVTEGKIICEKNSMS